MPQPKKATRFGGSPGHHNLIMANLATELFRHGRITTTLAKAKTVQPVAERMVTFAKRGDVHARRQVLRVIRDRDVVHKLFADVGPAFAERDGGYTRVLKTGPRKGDAAPMAIIELVEGVTIDGEGDLAEAPRRRWSLRRRAGTLSATARDREEDRAAAADRGEELDTEVDPEGSGALAEAVPVGALPRDESAADSQDDAADSPDDAADSPQAADGSDGQDGLEADPAEVEARLAAQDEQDEAADQQRAEAAVDAEEQGAKAADAEAKDAQAGDQRADGDPRA